MTRRPGGRVTPTVDAPQPHGQQGRLHPSGWGRPPEPYRTPALGRPALLELPLILGSWPELDEARRTRVQEAILAAHGRRRATVASAAPLAPTVGVAPQPLPPQLVGDLARWAREGVEAKWGTRGLGLHHRGAGASSPLIELQWLRDTVVALQWTAGVVLAGAPLAAHEDPELPPFNHPTNVEEVALALVTAALLHGPLVQWGAAPSLDLVQSARRLRLRWIAPARAHPVARRQWERLLTTGGDA
jgi:hypothetical protein